MSLAQVVLSRIDITILAIRIEDNLKSDTVTIGGMGKEDGAFTC